MFSASDETTSCTLGMLAVLDTCRTKLLSDLATMDWLFHTRPQHRFINDLQSAVKVQETAKSRVLHL
jgi:hypothetical protein